MGFNAFYNRESIYIKLYIMESVNFGIAKTIVANKVSNEFLNESNINNSKNFANDFIKLVKENPVLMFEYTVIENIENKHIENDVLAAKFIDENIKLFEAFTKKEVQDAHDKLVKFIDVPEIISISESKKSLYDSIGTLVFQSASGEGNINESHDAYANILNYVKSNITENVDDDKFDLLDENIDLDSVIEVATKKFNTKFESLNEDEKCILIDIVYGEPKKKKELFESLKFESLEILTHSEKNGVEDKINEGIEKLNQMESNVDTVNENLILLYNLKQNLI